MKNCPWKKPLSHFNIITDQGRSLTASPFWLFGLG
jgi:hypothetical protein